MSRTIRRDKLERLARAGKLVAVGSCHYDDMHGENRKKGIRFPVRIQAQHGDFVEGFYNLLEFDFRTHSGYATVSDDGKTAHLGVHSNCNYDFEMADGSVFDGNGKTATAHRPENARMQAFLLANGIEATPKYLPDGSLRGCWRLYNKTVQWTLDLAAKLNGLGFVDYDGNPLGQFSGNGGMFAVFVRGHNELLNG